jgi:aquaporin Z
MSNTKRWLAECVGTFVLVLGGCGSAVLAAGIPGLGIGFTGVALAFGLSVLAMVYALGHISGAHFNPAVTLGLVAARRFPARELPGYVGSQIAGAVFASAVLYAIARGIPAFSLANGFASNGYGAHSPNAYSIGSVFLIEVFFTAIFVLVVLGATDARAPKGFAGLAIGFALTLVHLVGIPVSNVSVNPARSTGPALFVGGWALEQLWMFWFAPCLGALLAAFLYRVLAGETTTRPEVVERAAIHHETAVDTTDRSVTS